MTDWFALVKSICVDPYLQHPNLDKLEYWAKDVQAQETNRPETNHHPEAVYKEPHAGEE